ncbi:hypothetical protein [Akkermansia glycaniphila]|uniref:Uncharacterized protein n=1 Tax=Akkermansia glycaniphila TaxID=1679444 RepID=A0A1C7PAR5_9BACT|nr:hypothetical protein [Akkermansia glycaniphila]OCA02645.1 hypothetical protein AC781_09165 [Akkermansia glycaniphila]SEH77965.1 Hypothetical protein PYTT_0687 [Akkermansia glycaniphila]
MKTHTLIPTLACLGILAPAMANTQKTEPAPTPQTAPQSISADIKTYRQIWMDFFSLLDTIQDTASANKAVPALQTLNNRLNAFQAAHPYNRLSENERQFIQNTGQEIRRINSEKKQANRIIDNAFYQSDSLLVSLTDEECPFNALFRNQKTEHYAMQLAYKAQETADQPNNPYIFAKDDMAKDAEQRHANLLAQPDSPYQGGMGLTEEDAVILHEQNEEKQQELQYAYLETVYPAAKPFYGLVQATPDNGFYNIIIVNISDDIEKRTGKRPEQPALIPVYFRIDTPAAKNEKPEEN